MGIVNATPDSFSGDGTIDVEAAVARAAAQLERGADIVDVGGESTRPGATPVGIDVERERVLPVIARLRARRPDAVISCDTYRPELVAGAKAAGADLLNSVRGLVPGYLEAAVEAGLPVVIVHNQGTTDYPRGVVAEVLASLAEQAARALRAGLAREAIILDPGIGFAKTPEQNLALLAALGRLVALGFPTLLGTSRKSTIGKLTGRSVAKRAFGTAATVALACGARIDIVRVHDVAEMLDTARVADAIARGWRPGDWNEPEPGGP
jgi:dihydropteroate synthase